MKRLLLGDEALALGALNAGLGGVYAYPGTPSTEITEYIQGNSLSKERGIHTAWCTNEKTAMEAALGMSYAGRRALVCMKHVGMNVAADAFVNSAITGVNGGLVVVAADDPSMHSSQNEQDSRFYGKFAMLPVMEPSSQQETYDMISEAFELSEELHLPVLFRMVTRLAHSRASVEISNPLSMKQYDAASEKGWVLLPAIARRQYNALIEKQSALQKASLETYHNRIETIEKDPRQPEIAVVASGIAYNYVLEAVAKYKGNLRILKISQYPLPEEKIKRLTKGVQRIIVAEDGQPFIEEQLCKSYKNVEGRLTGLLPRTGELTPDTVASALGIETKSYFQPSGILEARPPQLCPGCGHRDVYAALNKVMEDYPKGRIFGDIGCYTLGALPPFKALASCVDMGASIGMAKGASDAGLFPAVAVIGDSTFTHSGMTCLLDAVNAKSPITVVLSDNLTTAMTGGQDSAGTSRFEAICIALGVEPEHVKVVVPTPGNIPSITETLREEIQYKGVSVIIPRRECMQTLKRHQKQTQSQKPTDNQISSDNQTSK